MQKPEKQLPFPVYFVYPDQSRGAGVFGAEYPPDPDTEPWRYYTTADCWVMLTYVHLKRRGFDARLATRPVPESINVIAGYDLGIKNCAFDSYMVACRSDSNRPMICAHTIVQNPHNAIAPTEHLIQHWPQPGLLSRLPGRGDRVERIVFKGADFNLWKPFAGAEFRQALAMLGVEFRIDGKPEDRRQCRWHDYRDTDLVLAVRDLTEMDYYIKPASKLINAWHAGTPALLGPEPAFQALRRSELDYVEIRTPEEAVQAVRRLKEDPKLYRTMVENGRSRGREFTTDAIASRWYEVLANPVASGFDRWRRRPSWFKALSRPTRYAALAAVHCWERRKYRKQRDHGYRPISSRTT